MAISNLNTINKLAAQFVGTVSITKISTDKRCNCEMSKCNHGKHGCENKAGDKKMLYVGAVCDKCAEKCPKEYMKKDAAKKEKKKLDPKAKLRNRGTVCVPAERAKDKKDHFPINDADQARNALSRVEGLTSAPWFKGTLDGLRALV